MKKKKYKKVPLKKNKYQQGGNPFSMFNIEDILGKLTQTNVQDSLQNNNYFSDIANEFNSGMADFGIDPNSAGSGLGLFTAELMNTGDKSRNSALSASNDLISQMFKNKSHIQPPKYAQNGLDVGSNEGIVVGQPPSEMSLGVDPTILAGIESSYNPKAVSETGARGLGQVTTTALTEFNRKTGKKYTRDDMFDPQKNVEVMKKTLNEIIPKQLKGKDLPLTLENVLSAYRQGTTGLKKNGLTELDKDRADIYRSAEYNDYNNAISFDRAGKTEMFDIPSGLDRNPFMPTPKKPEFNSPVDVMGLQKGGEIPINPNGLYEENGPVIIPSNNITMKGINKNVLGIGDNGMTQLMRPNQNYKFNGANSVLEIPMAKNGMYVNGVDQHGFGDFIKGIGKGIAKGVGAIGKGVKDVGLFGLDNASNLLLGTDFIKDGAYSFDFSKGLSNATGNIANKIGDFAVPLAATAFLGPGAAAAVSGIRGTTNALNDGKNLMGALGSGLMGAGASFMGAKGLGNTGGFGNIAGNTSKTFTGGFGNTINNLNNISNNIKQPQQQPQLSYPGYAGGMLQVPQQARQQSNPLGNMMDIFGMAKQFGLFQNGGQIPQFSYKEGGHIGQGTKIGIFPNGTPIQAEKIKGINEQIIFPDGRIADVHASDSHSKMNGNGDDDMVTDILPEGAYITSAYGGIKIKKKDADEIVTGIKQYAYEEGKKGKEPELFTVGDIFKKNEKKVEPATLSKRIQDTYKIIDKTDIFGEVTNKANLQARLPLLQGVIGLSDIEKQKKEEAKARRQMTKAESQLIEEGLMFQKGGRVRKSQMKDYQAGGLLSTAATLLPSVLNIFGVGQNNESVDPRFQETYGNLNNLYNTEPLRYLSNQNLINQYGDTSKDLIDNSYRGFNQANALGTGLQAAGTLLQTPDVKFTETDLSQFDARNRQLRRDASNYRREIRDNTFSQIPLAELARSGNLNSINSVYNTGLSNVNKGISDANRQLSADQGRVFEQKFNTSVANDRGRDAAFNQGTANRNNQLSALTDTVAQGIRTSGQSGLSQAQSMQGLESNLLQSILGNNAQTLNNQIGILGTQSALLNNPTQQPQVSGSGNLLNRLLNGYNNSTFGSNLTVPDIGSNIFNQSGVSALQGIGADTGFSLNIPSFGFGK